MNLILNQQYYTDIKTTSKESAQLLFSSKLNNKSQPQQQRQENCKLIVADNTGTVHVFQYSNGLKHFKFTVEQPITCLRVGANKHKHAKQHIFICYNYKISGFTSKGKPLFEFPTNIQGHVNSMFIQDKNIYFTVGCMYQRIMNWKEMEFLLLPDMITSIYVINGVGGNTTQSLSLVVLACKDKLIRVLKDGVVFCELEVSSPPVCLNVADKAYSSDYLMYGTSEGQFGLIQVTSEKISKIWEITSKSGSDEILSLQHYDMLNNNSDNCNNVDDGNHDQLIVSYSRGRIELYTYDQNKHPVLIYETNVNHHLTSVKACRFSNIDYPELLCVTYTGMIFGLTTEPIKKEVHINQPDRMQLQFKTRLTKLNDEIIDLENQLQQLKSTQEQIEKERLILIPLELDYKFYFNTQLAAYCLNLETQLPIDHLMIQSDCFIDLLDVEDSTAVCSSSICKKPDGMITLTTYRCQMNTTHFELQFRTVEGQYGQVLVYIVPKMNTSTVTACKSIKLSIHPLSLHRLCHHINDGNGDESYSDRLWNSLQLSGQFSLTEMHNWLSICLPETPERPTILTAVTNDNGDNQGMQEYAELFYTSIYFHSQLKCYYEKGKARLLSDNISTIAILKDVLTKEANKRKIQLTIQLDIHPKSSEYMLRKIDTKLTYLKELELKVKLIEPITELISNKIQCFNASNNNNNTTDIDPLEQNRTKLTNTVNGNPFPDSLPSEYAEIWRNSKALKDEFKHKSCQLKIYYDQIINLYIDKYRFQGLDVSCNKDELMKLLQNYNLEKIIEYFEKEPTR
ncbi:unnamed protein product [Trichobilharzia szidati]|nr:unnamed protein product [Trichobilharzia szidati]